MPKEENLAANPQPAARDQGEKVEQGSEVAEAAAPEAQLRADLSGAYQKALEEKKELYDRLLRKQAELENLRKRLHREKDDFLQHATADLIRALLPALDGFERALKQRDASVPENFYQGMELIYRQVFEVLGRAGLTPIETLGKTFDPHLHQAVETVEAAGYRDQEIIEELQKGYKLRQRLLRPAVVKVAVVRRGEGTKPKPESSDQPESKD